MPVRMINYLTGLRARILLKYIAMKTQKEVSISENISITRVAQHIYMGLRSIRGAYENSKTTVGYFDSHTVLNDMARNSSMTEKELTSLIQDYIREGLDNNETKHIWEIIPSENKIPVPTELLDFIYEKYMIKIEDSTRRIHMDSRNKTSLSVSFLTNEMVEAMLKCCYMKTRKQVADSMGLTPPQVKSLQEKGFINIRLAFSESIKSGKFQSETVLKDMAVRSGMKPEELVMVLNGCIKYGLSSKDKKYWERIPCESEKPTAFELLDFLYIKYDFEIKPL